MTKPYEIDRAWVAHEPLRAKIPYAIWQDLSRFKRELQGPAQAMARWMANTEASQRQCTDVVYKRGLGRERVLSRIRRTLPGVTISVHDKIIEFQWLEPDKAKIKDARRPGERQDCIMMWFAVAWMPWRGSMQFWSDCLAEFPDHATARLMQRAGSSIDLRECLFEAGHAFSRSDGEEILRLQRNQDTIYLASGPGAFLAKIILGKDESGAVCMYARPRTWLHVDLLQPHQKLLARAAPDARSTLGLLRSLAERNLKLNGE